MGYVNDHNSLKDYYVIKKKSLLYVAKKILTIKNSNQKTEDFYYVYENEEYLIISMEKLCKQEVNKFDCEKLPTKDSEGIDFPSASNICYSIHLARLEKQNNKYKILAQRILIINYPFAQAKVVTDMYEEQWLTLFN